MKPNYKTLTDDEMFLCSKELRTKMLVYFLRKNHPSIDYLKSLIDCGVDIEWNKSHEKRTLLHLAARYNRAEILKYLIDAGADVNAKDKTGKSPLHTCSIFKNRLEIAKILIDNGANINAQTNKGWTPLHFCAERGFLLLAEFLIEHRARRGLANAKGYLPYDYAKYRSHKKIFSF